jgi:DNA transformation protein and related proteins
MVTKASTADFLLEQLGTGVTLKKMLGEYGLYLEGKMFAMVCDDQLYVKPTPAGRAFLGEVHEAAPYAGAKPAFVIAGDRWEDGEWLAELAALTARELPDPKTKRAPGASGFAPRPGSGAAPSAMRRGRPKAR